MSEADCDEVDAFVGSYKTLAGLMPAWIDFYDRDWQVRWGIEDAFGIQRGELCMTCDAEQTRWSISAIFRQKLIYRLDVVPMAECKSNPYGALAQGLSARVCGPHAHPWVENRPFVSANGFGRLPYRREIDGSVSSITASLAWVAQDLNIQVDAQQRLCEMPPQSRLPLHEPPR